ncbi:hypothetical protein [Paraburkholderia sp. J94]|uniref:hypothetical protein n=1 Tax=Paraburkholderia sp. J94 TaxID=2805441 RepID=UPI002AAF6D06|nr:hypothetical protein [Paraburkholderia sp. J94]
MDERNVDLVRLTVERELERVRAEVASAKAELETIKASLTQQVADAKVQIGDQAMDKMQKVFAEFRAWALFGIVLLGAAGGFSVYQIYTSARQTIESKITDWLSFDKKGALLKESLESIRMRVVLDGFVTRIARSSLSGNYRSSIELSTAEKSRLVVYMLDPDTSELDFRDGARILAAHLGLFYPGVDTKIDELLSKTMSRFKIDSYRPRVLLETLKRYQGVYPYADSILKSPNVPNDLREAAFGALSGPFYGDDASKYAMAALLTEQYAPLAEAEAKVIVDEEKAVGVVDRWLATKTALGEGIGARVMLADSLATHLSSMNFDAAHQRWIAERTASLLVSAISQGAKLDYDDRFWPQVTLGFRTDGTAGFRQPEHLFDDNNTLMPAMLKTASSAGIPAETFVRALTTKGTRGEVFGLRVILNSASLIGETFGTVNPASVAGPLLLVADDKATVPAVQVSFRAKDGRWVTDRVKSFINFYSANVSFAYDKAVLQLARTRNLNDQINSLE